MTIQAICHLWSCNHHQHFFPTAMFCKKFFCFQFPSGRNIWIPLDSDPTWITPCQVALAFKVIVLSLPFDRASFEFIINSHMTIDDWAGCRWMGLVGLLLLLCGGKSLGIISILSCWKVMGMWKEINRTNHKTKVSKKVKPFVSGYSFAT